jgi:ABC-type polar amino acid transport system ATPase subunit
MNISISHLSHSYDVQVLNDLHLSLEGYKSIAIIGVSGSGKSTLLRILSGLEKPTTGLVEINNHSVDSEQYRKSVGFVFQHHNLFPHLTLLKNITLILEKTRGYTHNEAQERAMKFLEMLHLADQAGKLPKHVSGGQAQRGSIARALSLDPEVIFLDEPTSALDPILTYEVLSAIKELRDVGKAFILVSHVISFVKEFADYILFMHKGHIYEQGLPSILDDPQTQELKDFMAKVP